MGALPSIAMPVESSMILFISRRSTRSNRVTRRISTRTRLSVKEIKSENQSTSRESSPSKSLDPNKVQEIQILPDGSTYIEWVNTEFSEFIIKYVMSEKERENYTRYGSNKIYCG